MSTDSFRVRAEFPVPPLTLYEAWISGPLHAAMTGAAAICDARPGGEFTAWDGYISGTIVELAPGVRIVQRWRTLEFAAADPDSRLVLELSATPSGCALSVSHSEIPAGQGASYEGGWEDHYFAPMRAYFAATAQAS